ncbi:MAG: carbonic anhydrase [Rhizobiales bacterium 62-17]|nr:carbonic anhydrase [Hyphomicrobiales bacterium]OJY04293.1 MAG: carbonic anhydrase [Rhizobiales bacterium 62-17]
MCDRCSLKGLGHELSLSRRHLLRGSAALATATLAPLRSASAQNAAPQNTISPDEALKRIMDGNARYTANTSANQDYSVGRAARATAQHPIAAILSCADSRVAPELAFDQAPGDLFVVRLAGNFVNDDGLASLEYAVKILNTPLIMVLGHSNCGAVDAAIKVLNDGATLPGHLQQLVRDIKPAVAAAQKEKPANLLAASITQNIRNGVRRLETAKPILADLVQAKKIKVVGAQYDLATGKIALV